MQITKQTNKWLILAISFLLMFVFSISLQALPPIFDNIIQDIPFSDSQAGLLMSSYSFLGIVIPLVVAFSLKRLDLKKMLIGGLVAVIVGLVGFALSRIYSLLLVFRLISGAGATILAVLAPLLITMYFDENKIGIAMGIFNTAVPLGMVVAANLFGYLGSIISWKAIIGGIAVIVAAVLATVLIFLNVPRNKEEVDSSLPKMQLNLGTDLWILGALWMIFNGQLVAYTTFGSQFFQLSGMSTQLSGLLTSQIMLVTVFLAPVVGIIIDKTKQKKLFLLIGSIIVGVSFLSLAVSWLSIPLWAVALGVGNSFISVCIFALLPDVVKPAQTSMGLAVITAASNLGITIGPFGFGSLLDKTSRNFTFGFILLALCSLLSIIMILRIRIKTEKVTS